jgi:hypothetical protein
MLSEIIFLWKRLTELFKGRIAGSSPDDGFAFSEEFNRDLREFSSQLMPLMDRHTASQLVLMGDPFYAKIPNERLSEAVQFGIDTGAALARKQISKFNTRDPIQLAEKLGIIIRHSQENSRRGPRVYHSEYSSPPPTILIYDMSMADIERMIDITGLKEILNTASSVPIYVAHEIYHHLEMKVKPSPTASFRVSTFSFGPINLTSGLISLSEIAADSFAQELLDFKYPPKLFEQLTIYRHNPELGRRVFEIL